jgi:hypothetical protein
LPSVVVFFGQQVEQFLLLDLHLGRMRGAVDLLQAADGDVGTRGTLTSL